MLSPLDASDAFHIALSWHSQDEGHKKPISIVIFINTCYIITLSDLTRITLSSYKLRSFPHSIAVPPSHCYLLFRSMPKDLPAFNPPGPQPHNLPHARWIRERL